MLFWCQRNTANVFLVSGYCCVILPPDAMGLSVVCDCGIFQNILTISEYMHAKNKEFCAFFLFIHLKAIY